MAAVFARSIGMVDDGDHRHLVASGYDEIADTYAALESEARPWPRSRWVSAVLERLAPRSAVLDLGCGSGLPVMRTIADAGHSLTGVDLSQQQLARARQNVPEAALVHKSIDDVAFPASTFDAVVSLYTIEHIRRELHSALLESIHRWLRDDGCLLLTCEVGDEPGRVGTWLGVPMYLSHYDADTMQQLVRRAGFNIIAAQEETQLEAERAIPYLWILAARA